MIAITAWSIPYLAAETALLAGAFTLVLMSANLIMSLVNEQSFSTLFNQFTAIADSLKTEELAEVGRCFYYPTPSPGDQAEALTRVFAALQNSMSNSTYYTAILMALFILIAIIAGVAFYIKKKRRGGALELVEPAD